ncbi:hypothetical protein JQ581_30090 [Bradyrhizobium liaoningense]|uniref:hypothetical protein n=1 Tax=Bradyrhizobium liaoningense TaxID=43992 RepID=UPI001BAC4E35|nr:hypothetical protein [Bradyrhizobium liaoningense]MBR0741191.1 hypothetical protein [Bradyrhizobium liaoningense]
MVKHIDMEGVLYFSQHPPEIIGQLTIAGINYEIIGRRHSEIKAEIKARVRGPVQTDLFEDSDNEGDQRI